MLEDWDEDVLEVLPPIETICAQDGMTHGQRVAVRLKAEVTEIGTLLLSCVNETDGAWNLEFNVRLNKTTTEDNADGTSRLPKYVVGIDLGTTNSAVAYANLSSAKRHGSRA